MAKYVGKRVVPKHCGAWSKNKEYEMLSIVLDEASGESYISRRVVPTGTLLTDEYYWSICSLFSQQIADMGEEFEERQQAISQNNAETLRQIRADNDATETAIRQDNDATEQAVNAVTSDALAAMNQAKLSFDSTSASLTARMDSIAGSATEETEILDARVDKDNVTHESLGAHIRSIGNSVTALARDTAAGAAIGYGNVTEKHLAILEESVNLIDTSVYEEGYISTSTGRIVTGNNYRTSDYIPVSEGDRLYLIKAVTKGLGGFYNDLRQYIGPLTDYIDESDGVSYTVPADVSYIRVCYLKGEGNPTPMLSRTKDAYYRPYGMRVREKYLPTQEKEMPDEIRECFVINRLNPETVVEDTFIPSSGTERPNESYRATDYIRIAEGETLYLFKRNLTQVGFRMTSCFDKDKNNIQTAGLEDEVSSFTQSGNVAYVRFTLYKTSGNPSDLMITNRANPEFFMEYGATKIPKKYLEQQSFPDILGQADIDSQTNFRAQYLITNLLDPAQVVKGYYCNKGRLSENPSYDVTNIFPVQPGMTCCCFNRQLKPVGIRFHDCYDAAGNVMVDACSGDGPTVQSFVVPEGVAFARLTLGTGDAEDRMVIMDDSPTRFYAHGEGMIRNEYINLSRAESEPHVHLPKDIYCASGRTIELYNNQVCLEVERYHVRWICSVGRAYKRKVAITGTDENLGDYTLTLELYNDDFHCVWTGKATVHIVKNTLARNYTCCPIGDSLTNGKAWLAEVMRLSDFKMSYVGSRPASMRDTEGVVHEFGHEGRSGFSAMMYLNGSPYTFNAPYEPEHNNFWDGERFNWDYYKSTYGVDPDCVQIYLGTNNLKVDNTETAGHIQQMVDLIRQDDPDIPIFVVNTIYRGTQDAVGAQISDTGMAAGVGSYKYYEDRRIMDLMVKLDALLQDYENVHMINLAVSHDSEYNFGAVEEPVNPRAVQTQLVPVEAVHPQQQGYFQMADVMFSVFCGVLE